MTGKEFEYEFDIMWNNIMSNQAPGLSLYEKCVFFTQAQETIVKGIYNGSLTSPFESTEEARSYISPLVTQGYPKLLATQSDYPHITKGSILYDLTDIRDVKDKKQLEDVWFITYEGVIFDGLNRCNDNEEGIVKPVTQDNFWETHRNPFRNENERRVLRLTFNDNPNIVELISKYKIKKYFIRYVRKPYPIITSNLDDGLTIDGKSTPLDNADGKVVCELNDALHRVILETAVRIAQQAWTLTNVKQ